MSRDPREMGPVRPVRPDVGLCTACAHALRVPSSRGSEFWQCRLSAVDPAFPKYPRLPVRQCAGYLDDGVNPQESR